MIKKTIRDLHRISVEEFQQQPKRPFVLVLDNIRSLNNVGSMFRTADAFGIEGIYLCGTSGTPPAVEIHKTALGAEDAVAWKYYANTAEAVRDLQAKGYMVCCLEQVFNSVSLEKFQPTSGKYAVVIGNEVDGVLPEVVDMCDLCLEIPQYGTKHSLNAAVSAGIALWHLFCSLSKD